MPANAKTWLEACARPAGKLWLGDQKTLHAELRALCKLAGFAKWPRNALRKSACTYADLLAMDSLKTAGEAGNSPAMLARHYIDFAGLTRADAQAWFAIVPKDAWSNATVRLNAANE
jgi:hypothetical protein